MLGGWYWGPLGRPGPTRLGGEGQRGRGRAPDSKEGRAQKSRGEGKCGKASGVKQKVRLRPRRGPRGLEVLGPPGWSCRGPSQRPPPSHGPRGAAGGLLSGPAPRARAANSLPSRDLSRTPCKTRARLGPRDTLEPALGVPCLSRHEGVCVHFWTADSRSPGTLTVSKSLWSKPGKHPGNHKPQVQLLGGEG